MSDIQDMNAHLYPAKTARAARPASSVNKATRIVKLALSLLQIFGFRCSAELEAAMLEFECRIYEMDTDLETLADAKERVKMLESHKNWVLAQIPDFPTSLILESLFFFGQEQKFQNDPRHVISEESIRRISRARSNDVRALFALVKAQTGFSMPQSALAYINQALVVFDVHEDMVEVAPDFRARTYNTFLAFARLTSRTGEDFKACYMRYLESEMIALAACGSELKKHYSHYVPTLIDRVIFEGSSVTGALTSGLLKLEADLLFLHETEADFPPLTNGSDEHRRFAAPVTTRCHEQRVKMAARLRVDAAFGA